MRLTGGAVSLIRHHDLWRTIPPRSNVYTSEQSEQTASRMTDERTFSQFWIILIRLAYHWSETPR
jgi:hypothetical protein